MLRTGKKIMYNVGKVILLNKLLENQYRTNNILLKSDFLVKVEVVRAE